MATFKKPCIHCGTFVEGDGRFCFVCGSHSPFGYHCPSCGKEIQRNFVGCPGCGRYLTTVCPLCGGSTFVGSEKCDACGRHLMIQCDNKRCTEKMYFEITTCTACGKTIKSAKEQIEALKRGMM